MSEDQGRHAGGSHIGDRFREKGSLGSKDGREKEQTAKEDQLAECRAEQCELHLPERSRLIDERILDGKRDDHRGKELDIPHRAQPDLGIPCKERHIERRARMCYDHHKRTKADAEQHDTPDCLLHARCTAKAVIEAHDWLAAERDPAERHRDEEQIALDDRRTGHERIALARTAVALQHCIEHDEQDTVTCDDQKRRKSKRDDFSHNAQLKAVDAEAHRHFFRKQRAQYEHAGGELREHRRDRCPFDTHMAQEDKDRIQDDIEHRAEHDGRHAKPGEALCDQKAVHAGGNERKDSPGCINAHIRVGIVKGRRARAEPHEQLRL